MTLVAHITASGGTLPGDATLVIRTQHDPNLPPRGEVSYNVYADNGAYYAGGDRQSLTRAVDHHENMSDGIDASEVAAARPARSRRSQEARLAICSVDGRHIKHAFPLRCGRIPY